MTKSIKSIFRRQRAGSSRGGSSRSDRSPSFGVREQGSARALPTEDLEAVVSLLKAQLELPRGRRANVGNLLRQLREQAADDRTGEGGRRLEELLTRAQQEAITPYRTVRGGDERDEWASNRHDADERDTAVLDAEAEAEQAVLRDVARVKGRCEEAKMLTQELLDHKVTWSPDCRNSLEQIIFFVQLHVDDLNDRKHLTALDDTEEAIQRVLLQLQAVLSTQVADVAAALQAVVELLHVRANLAPAPASPSLSAALSLASLSSAHSSTLLPDNSHEVPSFPASLEGTPLGQGPSSILKPTTGSGITPPTGFASPDLSELQARYGTGTDSGTASSSDPTATVPTPAQPAPPGSPAESAEESDPTDGKSIISYRGHHMTRSALQLILNEEALAQADSSGQYAGPLEFDEVRGGWIPADVRALRPGDVARGEVPDTDPAHFERRRKDQWGNRIGFKGGKMSYLDEEPEFQLPEENRL